MKFDYKKAKSELGEIEESKGSGKLFYSRKNLFKNVLDLYSSAKALAGIQRHLHSGKGSYSFIPSCSTDHLRDLGQMTSQFHVVCPCPPLNSSVCLNYELSATRTVVLYDNKI